MFKRYNIKKILLAVLWIAIGCGSVVILAAAVHAKDLKYCRGIEINISGVSNNFFIDKEDVKKIITSYAGDNVTAIEIEGFDLVAMEAELKREVWIKNAELYFDNNDVLQASVNERDPVARIFTAGGNTFYIDSSNMMLPLSEKVSARVPVFTGFPSETKVLSKADSNLLNDIKNISEEIQQDPFLMGMIDQVDVTPQRSFEMIPKIGDQVIVFGDASDAMQKFSKLELFYKKVMNKYGWNRYSIINLQYKGQVIGKLKGKDDISADSLPTVEIMHAVAINTARAASDSLQTIMQDNEKNTTDISLIQQSIERDEGDEQFNTFQKYPEEETPAADKAMVKPAAKTSSPVVRKPVIKANKPAKPVVKHVKTQVTKPVITKPVNKPKLLMPPKNDY